MNEDHQWNGFITTTAGLLLGCIGTATLVAISFPSCPHNECEGGLSASDWLQFSGALLSGAMTLGAAVYAFGLTQRQVKMQADELGGLRAERENRAETLRALLTQAAAVVKGQALNGRQYIAEKFNSFVPPAGLPIVVKLWDLVEINEMWRLDKRIVIAAIEVQSRCEAYIYLKSLPVAGDMNTVSHIDQRLMGLAEACDVLIAEVSARPYHPDGHCP